MRKVDPSGIITTIAGTGVGGYSGDGGPATAAQLWEPVGIAVDAANNIYISDVLNSCIRKITPAGIISTYAGNGTTGYSGDGGQATAAQISGPGYIFIDVGGNLYIPEHDNNTVRKVDPSGIITTIAGTGVGGFSGDSGLATDAKLNGPEGVVVDVVGNIYITEIYNSRIRKINTLGVISTFAGTTAIGYNGDGIMATTARLSSPLSIVADNTGNIYFGDVINRRVRKIDLSGKISTIAGNGLSPFAGDGGPATSAQFGTITGVNFDAHGNLYIADMSSGRVRKVTAVTNVNDWELPARQSIKVYPNPSDGNFRITTDINSPQGTLAAVYNIAGQCVQHFEVKPHIENVVSLDLPTGIYFISLNAGGEVLYEKLVITN